MRIAAQWPPAAWICCRAPTICAAQRCIWRPASGCVTAISWLASRADRIASATPCWEQGEEGGEGGEACQAAAEPTLRACMLTLASCQPAAQLPTA